MAKRQTGVKRYTGKRSTDKQNKRSGKIKHVIFTVLVFVLVAAAVFFLVLRRGDSSTIAENVIGSLLTPVQNAISTVTAKVQRFTDNWRSYDALEDEYNALSLENARMNLEMVSAEEALKENERLKTLLEARDTYSALDPVYAKVIARDAGTWFETFSINRGTGDGVTRNMAVVNGDGLIGRVYEVGMNYAKVISIIDSRSSVACLVQRTRDNGIMRGQLSTTDDYSECYVYYLPNINNISPGDTVVTSGTDSLYPKGLKIGTVTAVSLDAGSEGTYAVVSPSADFQRIEEVFVLRTVIETDTDILPSVVTATQAPTASPTPNPDATATPAPDASAGTEYWSRPTVAPDDNGYSSFKINDLIEDTWAAN